MSWWKTAKAGDKVVCVVSSAGLPCADVRPFWRQLRWPAKRSDIFKGRIYTIRSIRAVPEFAAGVGIEVAEVPPPDRNSGREFSPEFFRPVVKRSTETGMAMLRSILKGKRVPDAADGGGR